MINTEEKLEHIRFALTHAYKGEYVMKFIEEIIEENTELKHDLISYELTHTKMIDENERLKRRLESLHIEINPCEGCKDYCYKNNECKTKGGCGYEALEKENARLKEIVSKGDCVSHYETTIQKLEEENEGLKLAYHDLYHSYLNDTIQFDWRNMEKASEIEVLEKALSVAVQNSNFCIGKKNTDLMCADQGLDKKACLLCRKQYFTECAKEIIATNGLGSD